MDVATLTRPAVIENLEEVVGFVESCADRFGLDQKKKFGLLLAIEEAFVNVCHYAYPGCIGEVTLACDCTDENVTVEISDRGVPFDILSLPDPDTTHDIMEREIGGLGVYFIRKMTDDARYQRRDGCNILRIAVHRTQDSGL